MPPSTHVYGIDTSVFVRLLTGHPEPEFQKTALNLKLLHEKVSSTELVVSNQVIGEAYITLQHHYSLAKEDARGGAGLLDRLIADDYQNRGVNVLIINQSKHKQAL